MIRFIISLIIFSICMGLGYVISEYPARMFFIINGYEIETSLVVWAICSFLVVYLLSFISKVLLYIWRTPARFSRNRQTVKKVKANILLKKGLNALTVGDYKKAEKKLAKGADIAEAANESSVLFLENAAIAADRLNAPKRRDHYLLRARKKVDGEDQNLAFLSEAELAVQNNQYQKAVKLLTELNAGGVRNFKIFDLLDQAYAALENWEAAWKNLPKLMQYLSADDVKSKKRKYAQGLLNDSAEEESLDELQSAWKKISSDIRNDKSMIILYSSILMENGHADEAEKILIQQIKSSSDLDYVQAYSQLKDINYRKALHYLKQISNRFPNDAIFEYCRARIAFNAGEYTLAEDFINESIKLDPRAQSYALLGRILEERKQPEKALIAYHNSCKENGNLIPPINGEIQPLKLEFK